MCLENGTCFETVQQIVDFYTNILKLMATYMVKIDALENGQW